MSKLQLYIDTARHLRPSQVAWRIWRRLGGETPLRRGHRVAPGAACPKVACALAMPELDFDPAFLGRFEVAEILSGKMTLLHKSHELDWSAESWRCEGEMPLWRFNLHYMEYLLPLARAGELDAAKMLVRSWIDGNPRGCDGTGWDPYTISMRVVNWLAFLGEAADDLADDSAFRSAMDASLVEQYVHLSRHLEHDLLANHYLEDLKALVILACYFGDGATLDLALSELEAQVAEQVLSDGAHFELSPMYQKIVFEDLLRVCVCLRECGRRSGAIESVLKPMCDFVYSMERGANRTPLFNDSGDNVAKSAASLLACAKERFGVEPEYRASFPDAGYRLLVGDCGGRRIKVVLDAGTPGPACACGHAHCDMLSMEVFVDGEPWVVNSGTYAYQDSSRLDWKRTAAHSTVQVEGVEQSECWAPFRMARMAEPLGLEESDGRVVARVRDCAGNVLRRSVELASEGLRVVDEGPDGKPLVQRWHFPVAPAVEGAVAVREAAYAPEFGERRPSACVEISGRGRVSALLDPAADRVVVLEGGDAR